MCSHGNCQVRLLLRLLNFSIKSMGKRLIPKDHCIRVCMWTNYHQDNLRWWEDYEPGMSSKSTGATSLTKAMKIVKDGLKTGFTHFVLSYPISNIGGTVANPHDIENQHSIS
jgi:hypothetical protein